MNRVKEKYSINKFSGFTDIMKTRKNNKLAFGNCWSKELDPFDGFSLEEEMLGNNGCATTTTSAYSTR